MLPGDTEQTEAILPFTAEEGVRIIDDDIGVTPHIYRNKYERTPKIRQESCIRPNPLTPELQEWVRGLREREELQSHNDDTSP